MGKRETVYGSSLCEKYGLNLKLCSTFGTAKGCAYGYSCKHWYDSKLVDKARGCYNRVATEAGQIFGQKKNDFKKRNDFLIRNFIHQNQPNSENTQF